MSESINIVIKDIKSLLITSTNKTTTIDELNKDYLNISGKNIPFKEFGFNQLDKFLKSLKDTICVKGVFVSLLSVPESSRHLNLMISNQKKKYSKQKRNYTYTPAVVFNHNNYFQNHNMQQFYGYNRYYHNQYFNQHAPYNVYNYYPAIKRNNQNEVMRQYCNQYSRNVYPVQQFRVENDKFSNNQHHQQKVPIINQNNFTMPTNEQLNHHLKPNNESYFKNDFNKIDNEKKLQYSGNIDKSHTPIKQKQINNYSGSLNQNEESIFENIRESVQENKSNLDNSQSEMAECNNSSFFKQENQEQLSQNFKSDIFNHSDEQEIATNNLSSQFDCYAFNDKSLPLLPEFKINLNLDLISSTPNCLETKEKEMFPNNPFSKDLNINQLNQTLPTETISKVTKVKLSDLNISSELNYSISRVEQNNFNSSTTSDDEYAKSALPFLSDDHIIFKIDHKYGKTIPELKFPDFIQEKERFEIFVTEVNNPNRFWFNLRHECEYFDELMFDIENYYKDLLFDELVIKSSDIRKGQICAAIFYNLWHRGEIVSEKSDKNKVLVFFIDYGTTCNVDIKYIKYLLPKFCELPKQAIRGSLFDIKPIHHRWERNVTFELLKLTEEKTLYCHVAEINEKEKIISMILYDTNGKDDININDFLIRKSLAENTRGHWKIENKVLTRQIHFAEIYPTFSMLETGQYKSFETIGRLLAKGIDEESDILDERLIPDYELYYNYYKSTVPRKYLDSAVNTNPFKIEKLTRRMKMATLEN